MTAAAAHFRVNHARFTEELAQIVRLHLIKRMTPAEISEALGIRLGLVKRRLNDNGYSFARARPVDDTPLGHGGEDKSLPCPDRDDAYVAALVARGGFPRLSEREGRTGRIACLPLIPFEARP